MAYGQIYDDAGDYGGPDPNDYYNDPGDGRIWDPVSQSWVWPARTDDQPDDGSLVDDTRGYDDTPAGPSAPAPGTLGALGQPGTLTAPFDKTFASPTPGGVPSWLPQVPNLNLPAFKPAAPFRPTTGEDVTADKGYGFLLKEGQTGVAQSAAARGLLNSGGTLKDIAKWTEDYAGTRFNDVDSRRRNDYMLDYQTQTLDPYRFAYQSALDSFAPQLTGWTTGAAAAQRNNELQDSNAWNRHLFDFDIFRDQRDSTWNKASQVLMA